MGALQDANGHLRELDAALDSRQLCVRGALEVSDEWALDLTAPENGFTAPAEAAPNTR